MLPLLFTIACNPSAPQDAPDRARGSVVGAVAAVSPADASSPESATEADATQVEPEQVGSEPATAEPPWRVRGPEGRETGEVVDVADVLAFEDRDWSGARVLTDPAALGRVARSTLDYIARRGDADPHAVHAGMAAQLGVTLDDVVRTLELVARTAEMDPERLQDPAFLAEHFRFVRWTGHAETAARSGVRLDDGRIRLTRYLVYREQGSLVKTDRFTNALYAVPRDEAGLTEDEAETRRDALARYRYTRSDVLDGVYEPGGAAEGLAEPLVWLTRRGVHEAIMQGTVEVHMPDGTRRIFNVDRSNAVPYDRSVRDPEAQDRFWYFREREVIGGWGAEHKVGLAPQVAVAGDLHNLGLGKLVALEDDGGVRLAVLADTGGAFQPNLYQLDLFTGTFDDHAAFQQATGHLPDRPRAGFLVAR